MESKPLIKPVENPHLLQPKEEEKRVEGATADKPRARFNAKIIPEHEKTKNLTDFLVQNPEAAKLLSSGFNDSEVKRKPAADMDTAEADFLLKYATYRASQSADGSGDAESLKPKTLTQALMKEYKDELVTALDTIFNTGTGAEDLWSEAERVLGILKENPNALKDNPGELIGQLTPTAIMIAELMEDMKQEDFINTHYILNEDGSLKMPPKFTQDKANQAVAAVNQLLPFLPNKGKMTAIFASVAAAIAVILSSVLGTYEAAPNWTVVIPWIFFFLSTTGGAIWDLVVAKRAKDSLVDADPNLQIAKQLANAPAAAPQPLPVN